MIRPGDNDRKVFDEEGLRDLAASIQEFGLAQPITVRPMESGVFEIIAGERRFRAMTHVLGWEMVPVIVREMGDAEASGIMLAENTARVNLNAMEEARAYQGRMKLYEWSVAEVASRAGVSVDRVRSRLLLLNLLPRIEQLVSKGQIAIQHAEIMGQQDFVIQDAAFRVWLAKPNMSAAELREIVSRLLAVNSQSLLFALTDELEEQMLVAPKSMIGRDADVPIVEHPRIPDFVVGSKESVGDACSRFMNELAEQGMTSEAAAVGTLYRALVRARKTFVAGNALTRKKKPSESKAKAHQDVAADEKAW